MTAKRFKLRLSKLGNGMITDTQKREMILYFDKEFLDATLPKATEWLNELAEENEQLKQRNTNQYNQLNQLWQLIEAKDWETLTAMDNQMKEDDKRLRNEWKCYE